MTSVICVRAPSKDSPAYAAAQIMRYRAPMAPQEVLALADFGPKDALAALNRHIDSGWFYFMPGGRLVISQFAADHFDAQEMGAPYVGQVATPRENLHAMEPLSRKYHLNVKGTRDDASDVRAYPSVYAKVAP